MIHKSAALGLLCAGVLTFAAAIGLNACKSDGTSSLVRIGAPRRGKLVIVFIDETGSSSDKTGMWDAMVDKTAKIASRLKDKDGLVVIGIDDHGNDEDDVRIPLTVLHGDDLRTAELAGRQKGLIDQIKALKVRGKPQRTDIVGAIHQAKGIADKMGSSMDVVLTFLSDMQQTPKMPVDADFSGIQFPQGTKAYCFYVDASKRYSYDVTVALWTRLLNGAGVSITQNEFQQKGTVDNFFNAAFPQS